MSANITGIPLGASEDSSLMRVNHEEDRSC